MANECSFAHMSSGLTKTMRESRFGTQIKNGDLVQRRRLQIAEGASKLFIKKGYFKTNMRDIAKTTGIPIGSLYDYITKKEDILCLVFDVFHSLCARRMEESGVFQIEDPVERLKSALEKMLELGDIYREMVLLMYRESKSLPKDFLKAILQRENAMVTYFETILQKGVDRRIFRVKDPFLTANMIVYLLAFGPLRGWNLRKRYQLKKIDEYLIDFILDNVLHTSEEEIRIQDGRAPARVTVRRKQS